MTTPTTPLTLTTKEINVAIALARGWKWLSFQPGTEKYAWLADPADPRTAHLIKIGTPILDDPTGYRQDTRDVPNYTADISAAWPLMVEMQAEVGFLSLSAELDKWRCIVVVLGFSTEAPTAELAIALAYLSWRTGRRVELKEETS